MTIIFGFLSSTRFHEDGSRLEKLSEADGTDELVLGKPGFVVNVRTSAARTNRIIGTTDDGVSVALVGRPLLHKGEAIDLSLLKWDQVAKSLRNLGGYWVAFAYDEKNHRLKVLCDQLGVGWLYWTRVPGGVAFSSDFGALARFLPKTPQINDRACLLNLTITYPLGDSTYFEGIYLVTPGVALEFHDGEVREERMPLLDYGTRWVGASRNAKFEALEAALNGSYEDWSCLVARTPWTLALSSGKDSRYCLGVLLQHAERPSCITFGLPGSTDVKGAMAICRKVQLKHRLFHPGPHTSWQSWRAAVQRLGVVAGFQYASGWGHEWRQMLSALDGQVVLGFLGDALSGLHLVDRFRGDWIANWEAWSLDEREDGSWTGSQMIRPEVRKRARDIVRAGMLAEIAHVDFPLKHQLALHLDLYSRQRRAVASQINFLTDEVAVAPLFYTPEMLEFWANLGYDDLRDQSLYLEFARNRFPRLFAPPRRASLIERAHGTLVNYAVDLWPDLRVHLNPPEIDTRALTGAHLGELKRLVREYADVVAHIVDVPALNKWLAEFGANRGPDAQELTRFWNLLLLVEAGFGNRGTRH